MFLLTERFLISEVAKRWLKQYSELPDWKRGVYEKLCKIDLNTASAIEVNQIIGNDTWTTQSVVITFFRLSLLGKMNRQLFVTNVSNK